MNIRVLGVVVAMLLVGGGIGAAAGWLVEPASAPAGVGVAVSEASPAVPTTPAKEKITPNADIDYPLLGGMPEFQSTREIGEGTQVWAYPDLPWQAYCLTGGVEVPVEASEEADCDEIRFRPEGEPTVGGYSLRVKSINQNLSTNEMVAAKLEDLRKLPDLERVRVLSRDADSLRVTFLQALSTGGYLLRYNFFRWFEAPGSDYATLEMSVAGRKVDEDGLQALFDQFATSTEAVVE